MAKEWWNVTTKGTVDVWDMDISEDEERGISKLTLMVVLLVAIAFVILVFVVCLILYCIYAVINAVAFLACLGFNRVFLGSRKLTQSQLKFIAGLLFVPKRMFLTRAIHGQQMFEPSMEN